MARNQAIEPKTKVLQIRLSEELYEKFKNEALDSKITPSELGRKIIEVFLE